MSLKDNPDEYLIRDKTISPARKKSSIPISENSSKVPFLNSSPSHSLISSRSKSQTIFTPDKTMTLEKQAILKWFDEFYPNLTKALLAAGINRRSFYEWQAIDEEFKAGIEEIRQRKADAVEDTNYKLAVKESSGTFMDRIAYLKKNRPEWNLDNKISVSHTMTIEDSRNRLSKLANVIDVDLIKQSHPEIGGSIDNLNTDNISSAHGSAIKEDKPTDPAP